MNSSSPVATTSRRRSGRVKSAQPNPPEDGDSSQASANNAKRKRTSAARRKADVDDAIPSSENSDDEVSDGGEDEWLGGSRRAGKGNAAPTKKPPAKKPRTTNGELKSLPVRPAMNGTKSAPKKAKPPQRKKSRSQAHVNSDEVDGDLFSRVSRGVHPDKLASDWIGHYNDEATAAMRDLINFVLKCAGCGFEVDVHDIEDPDNAPGKLEDLQEQYHAQKISDYPLIAKGKGTATLRVRIVGFVHSLLATANAANVLHDDPAVMENVAVWLTSMTDSTLRPFRHTATLIGLAMGSTLCNLASEYGKTIATFMRQKETESRNRKKINQARISGIDVKIKENEERREEIQRLLVDSIFDTIFAHRYRDVEPRIRLECASVLGNWIAWFPEVFFTGQYIRYYGWLLSDPSAITRAEVIKQLSKLYKLENSVGNLRAFTERFRPRMVEMAMRDAEPGIRAASIELLGQLRELGLLEPDDIDKVGRLIFDSDARVRKAVTPFIKQNVNDLVEEIIEELGGDESVDETLGEEVDDDFDRPRKTWLDYKALAETLQAYDAEEENTPESLGFAEELLAKKSQSRHGLAAEAVVDGLGNSSHWEVLAGYLLYDLSSDDGESTATEAVFKQRCQLNEQEQLLLLEILQVTVKARILEAARSEVDKKGKRSKVRTAESREIQEHVTLHLSKIIPKLLQKYSSNSPATAATLRLGQVLNLEVFHALRQDSTAYAALLDDINKQFITHTDQQVISEASSALLHARTFEDLEEVTDEKMQGLWATTIKSFRGCIDTDELNLADLIGPMRRLYSLASMSDCTGVFGGELGTPTPDEEPVTELLVRLIIEVGAGTRAAKHDQETGDSIASIAMKCLLLFFMWTAQAQGDAVTNDRRGLSDAQSSPLSISFTTALIGIMEKRRPATTSVCLVAAETYLDFYTLFATCRNQKSGPAASVMAEHVPTEGHPVLFHILNCSLKHFALKLDRKLEPDRTDDPVFEDDEDHAPVSDDEDEDEDELVDHGVSEEKQAALLLAEKQLCELTGKVVLAILARVFDYEGENRGKVKDLLLRNKTNLGPNFKEVVKFLETPKGKVQTRGKVMKSAGREQPETVELEDDPIEDEDDEGQEGGIEEVVDAEADGLPDEDDASVIGAQEDGVDDNIMGD